MPNRGRLQVHHRQFGSSTSKMLHQLLQTRVGFCNNGQHVVWSKPRTRTLQGDRRAGPSLTAFNYESRWGQLALKATYKGIMQEEPLPVRPPCCCSSSTGEPPQLPLQNFLGQVCMAKAFRPVQVEVSYEKLSQQDACTLSWLDSAMKTPCPLHICCSVSQTVSLMQ